MARGRIAASDRPSYPEIREEIGEDPARFLATELEEAPRIQGIASEGVLDAWEEVERDLRDEPRQNIIQQLEARRQQLQNDESESAALSEDAQALITDIGAMDDPEAVQAALDDEVAREDARTDVVAACNNRLDALAEEDDEPEPAREIPSVDYDSTDDPEYQTQYRDALRVSKAFSLSQVGERLEEEQDRDAPRPHVIDALETRQAALRSELPDGETTEEVTA